MMFCYQCEQTRNGTACQELPQGKCGKDEQTAELQDLLVYALKGVSWYAHHARTAGRPLPDVDAFVFRALFATVTNVNFDPERIRALIDEAGVMLETARSASEAAGGAPAAAATGPAAWKAGQSVADLEAAGHLVSIPARQKAFGDDVAGVQEMVLYGLKGAAAYGWHARILGQEADSVFAFLHQAMAALATPETDLGALLGLALGTGEMTLKVMELLDKGHTERFGHPEPTSVRIGHVTGKAILVSGHDMVDLENLLQQTEGTGINVYTHGEMLPAHGYPGLKKYAHLAGHYGGAWMRQRGEFDAFPGAVVMTTNCLMDPKPGYRDRLFTMNEVGWAGLSHIADGDFTPAIKAAQAAPGFTDSKTDSEHLVGFGHQAVLSHAGTVVDAVKSGALRHIMLVGGCDGSEAERSYFSDISRAAPQDWLVLTLGCGKFRVMGHDYGTLGGLPRLLDMGQCNDSYSAIKVAAALAEAFETDVNGLPLSLVLSWFEQKAVSVLLALLHLGVKGIRIGPALPAFVTPAVLGVLVEKFDIKPIGTVDEDLAAMGKAA